MKNKKCIFIFLLILMLSAPQILFQGQKVAGVTSPKEQFGFNIGDDYQLTNYTHTAEYWGKLAQESDRMILVEIGETSEGRTMVMAIITSPENHKKLGRYKEISRRLALAETLSEFEARELAVEGKAVVWIDGGCHASEVVGAHSLIEMVYQMVSQDDPETLRILNDVILLAVLSNPDGMDLVGNWYMKESDPKKRSTSGLPRLYQKYVGHDNNRDFYMVNMRESEAINRILYHEWIPQILFNHHQTGPPGSIIFIPPFNDPPNYSTDPLMTVGIEFVGAAIRNRYVAEGKPGAVSGPESNYQNWFSGGLRSTSTFHNMIGILSEIKGNPTPIELPFLPSQLVPKMANPYPILPQKWHFRQSIEYEITADRAVLDIASKYREEFLFNIYRMGKNSIERGSRDNWTILPKKIDAVKEAIDKDNTQMVSSGRTQSYPLKYYEMLFEQDERDARGYILPSDQTDFMTATKFINTLIKGGVTIHRATQSFKVSGKTYPKDSYVIKTAQAFRPHILDMMEPHNYPNIFLYQGGPPKPPYDSAGYTLAYQMGVKFDRILDGFEGPFEIINTIVRPPAGKVTGIGSAGFLLSHQVNDAFIAINRLLRNGEEVYWLKNPIKSEGRSFPAGTIYIPAKESTLPKLQKLADDIGLNFYTAAIKPSGEAFRLKPVRIGLLDRYGGSMPSGWVQWMFEQQFEFPFEVVYPSTLDAGNLTEKYDVLIFENGGILTQVQSEAMRRFLSPDPERIPAEYRHMLGTITEEKTLPQLHQFLKEGGTILAIGSSTSLGYYLKLPIANALVEEDTEEPFASEKYFVPGSILQVSVDNTNPLAYGMPAKLDVYFNKSPVFRLKSSSGMRKIAWFDSEKPLRSGWAWGQEYLKGGVTVIEAEVGKGKLFLFGPLITFRAQAHGTFKFLFNGIYYGSAETVKF